jgi:DNA-binding HxlR family transcriptional regulator
VGCYSLLEIYYIFGKKKYNKMKELDLRYPACPIRNVLSRFSDKWSLLILLNLLGKEKMRYKELLAAVPDISQKMLSGTLKRLEEDHLISRKAYAEIPPRVEYSLTTMGKSLMPALQPMIEWAQVNFEEVTG